MYLIFIFDIKTYYYINNVYKTIFNIPLQVGISTFFPIVILRYMFLLNLNKRKEYFFQLKIKNNEGKIITISKMKFYIRIINSLTKWYSITIFLTIPMLIFFIIDTIFLILCIFVDGNFI
jgi:hypothetical protein